MFTLVEHFGLTNRKVLGGAKWASENQNNGHSGTSFPS